MRHGTRRGIGEHMDVVDPMLHTYHDARLSVHSFLVLSL
jgi:hypothetical protein